MRTTRAALCLSRLQSTRFSGSRVEQKHLYRIGRQIREWGRHHDDESIGNALVAPTVKFVPEGSFDPPSDHMKCPGMFSVSQGTYEALLTDIAGSLRQHGFRHIVFIGDSGGNGERMQVAAITKAVAQP
jgi:creatinine amidohydrolase/Fe(II)-dependent formamide hydrolase-like protein